MSLESKIDGLKASIDALALAFAQFAPSASAAAPVGIPAAASTVAVPAATVTLPAAAGAPAIPPPAAAAAAAAADPKLQACRTALGTAAQRLGSPEKVVALLAAYIRPGSQPAGTPPNLEHVEPGYYDQLIAAAAALV